ncbi:MAG: DedA family protein [Propionibacteriaceae bacterium]|jgi:membrane protein DedA with SNARE-associated domain|nr:DedA family protein [Propionibacteriaceae bacterium]
MSELDADQSARPVEPDGDAAGGFPDAAPVDAAAGAVALDVAPSGSSLLAAPPDGGPLADGAPPTGGGDGLGAEVAEPAAVGAGDAGVAASEDGQTEDGETREWWDDPGLPWRHKPTRSDLICFGSLSAAGVYALAMMPLRPTLLALVPQVFGAMGHYTGQIMSGALAAVGDPWWPLVWFFGTFGTIKFDWIYWWAGRLWGRALVEVWSGKSDRARRRNEWAERFARKHETAALLLAAFPILPRGVVLVVLGSAGTTLRKFLTVSLIGAFTTTGCYLALGYFIGEPAVALMDAYSRYLIWLSVLIAVGMVVAYFRQQRKAAADA